MICDFCLMDRIVLLVLPITLIIEDEPPHTLQWGKERRICPMCIEAEALLIE